MKEIILTNKTINQLNHIFLSRINNTSDITEKSIWLLAYRILECGFNNDEFKLSKLDYLSIDSDVEI